MIPLHSELKAFPFSIILLIFLLSPLIAFPQETQMDSATETPAQKLSQSRAHSLLSALRPDFAVFQYAGSIGFISLGAGYFPDRRRRLNTELLAGYVPPYSTGRGKLTFTLRQGYCPFSIKAGRKADFRPLSIALWANLITGHEFIHGTPIRFPDKYYGFLTYLRYGISTGQRLDVKMKREDTHIRVLELYYDINATDLDISAFASNRSISLKDILNISFGVRLIFHSHSANLR